MLGVAELTVAAMKLLIYLLSILIVYLGVVSPTPKCQPNIICYSLYIIRGNIDLQCCNYCHLLHEFYKNFNDP